MVKLVLNNSIEHVREVVALAGNAFAEARVGKSRDGFDESLVYASGLGYGLAPR
jgi:hypothetical protein